MMMLAVLVVVVLVVMGMRCMHMYMRWISIIRT